MRKILKFDVEDSQNKNIELDKEVSMNISIKIYKDK